MIFIKNFFSAINMKFSFKWIHESILFIRWFIWRYHGFDNFVLCDGLNFIKCTFTTPEAIEQSYRNQAENGDILLTHFDHGVPWNEALNDESFPAEVETAIDEAIANKTPQHKVFLTATATDTDRDKLAKYWNDADSHQPLPADWADKSFNSPEVIEAYRKYCHRIIDAVQPDYFAYGIEINGSFKEGTTFFLEGKKPFR